ncbi:PQQ-dependent sugar dehydrogenase [Rhodohalobacter barkolensis]|uniref:Fibronectin type-III domain-containing protein n=1 Tax=Rhodohalobacter barkolensis TaxID=2053187 RepID=A0A2N0VGB3_9BACT|nr:PQQ-dependent sugar dehydrogenase [Rhodohalobacter barkolensis]PKD43236.1 hypothetical protein CWD77_11520 [Rhodohalobacter barkolensis]
MKKKLPIIAVFLFIQFTAWGELNAQSVELEDAFSETFNRPLGLEFPDDESNQGYIVSKFGMVFRKDFNNPETPSTTFIDISDRVYAVEGEQGLLGMAFSPNYEQDETFFLYYTFEENGEYYSTLARYKAPGGIADRKSEERLLTIFQPADNHNGGKLVFGPDGFLYVAVGDGGRGAGSNAQNTLTLNGSILRIDVSPETGYNIPPDNPFVGNPDGMNEIFAWGFRNPWRISFDPVTGYLWVADVGQKSWETIYIVENGKNYGWPVIEGTDCYPIGTECDKTGLEKPLYLYPWDEEDTGKSITGGYVYRGSNNPSLYGKYIYGDFISKRIWALEIDHDTKEVLSNTEIAQSPMLIPSFGSDNSNELYVVGWGPVARIFRFLEEESPAVPGKTVLNAPADGATDVSLDPTLRWEPVDQGARYKVQVSSSENFATMFVDESDVVQIEFELSGLDYETQYYWRVRAVNAAGDGEWSQVWSFTTIPPPVPDISIVAIEAEGEDLVLSWNSETPELIDEFIIYRGEEPAELTLTAIENLSGDQYSYTDTEILQGSSFYAVGAVDASGVESSLSDIVSFYNGELAITNEWEMVSIPVFNEEPAPENTQLFSFSGSYQDENSIIPLKGYWTRSNTEESISLRGSGLVNAVLNLESGWNMVGGLTGTIEKEAIQDIDGVLTNAPIYLYNGAAYEPVTTIEPGRGYWIYAENEGSVSLDIMQTSSDKRSEISDDISGPDLNNIIFKYLGTESKFAVSPMPLPDDQKSHFLVPPMPPEPTLDVRTNKGYSVSDRQSEELLLSTPGYPVTIRTQFSVSTNDQYRIIALDETGNEIHFNLTPGSTYSLEQPYDVLILERVATDELILETVIDPAYPNPFNPAAKIRYRLDQRSDVLLEVFDVTGRRMATLVNGEQNAGIYTETFNGAGLATGIYIVRLRAGSHQSFQKMTLIK